jgi:hypothetical protein
VRRRWRFDGGGVAEEAMEMLVVVWRKEAMKMLVVQKEIEM